MLSHRCLAQMRLRLSATYFYITFLFLSLAMVAAKFQPMLPSSERWG